MNHANNRDVSRNSRQLKPQAQREGREEAMMPEPRLPPEYNAPWWAWLVQLLTVVLLFGVVWALIGVGAALAWHVASWLGVS